MGLCAGTRTLDQEGEVLRALTRGLDTLTRGMDTLHRGLDTLTTFTTPDMADNWRSAGLTSRNCTDCTVVS